MKQVLIKMKNYFFVISILMGINNTYPYNYDTWECSTKKPIFKHFIHLDISRVNAIELRNNKR